MKRQPRTSLNYKIFVVSITGLLAAHGGSGRLAADMSGLYRLVLSLKP